MNASLSLTRNNLCQILRIDLFSNWLVQLEGPTFTYEDYLGDPEAEYAEYSASCAKIASEPSPISADEFEADYSWFLS
jgi:hypothetical protein